MDPVYDDPTPTTDGDSDSSLWDNPDGQPTPVADPDLDGYTTPWRTLSKERRKRDDTMQTTPTNGGTLQYTQPIHYHVSKTGYYCVGELLH